MVHLKLHVLNAHLNRIKLYHHIPLHIDVNITIRLMRFLKKPCWILKIIYELSTFIYFVVLLCIFLISLLSIVV